MLRFIVKPIKRFQGGFAWADKMSMAKQQKRELEKLTGIKWTITTQFTNDYTIH